MKCLIKVNIHLQGQSRLTFIENVDLFSFSLTLLVKYLKISIIKCEKEQNIFPIDFNVMMVCHSTSCLRQAQEIVRITKEIFNNVP